VADLIPIRSATLALVYAVMILNHRELETARAIVALQKPSYAVEAALIGYDQMPGLIEKSPADVAALELTMLGAFDEGQLAGILGYQRIADVVDLDRVAVSTAHFRRGIGRSLLEAFHQRESTAIRFEVSTGSANLAAIALYAGAGYRPVREETLAGIDIVHFERPGRGDR
jgi:ribosomal protein S18 acetylase RimI-like enzyme